MAMPNYALFYSGDAYRTDQKIMGRQSAGKAFVKAIAQRGTSGKLQGLGPGVGSARAMHAQLQAEGFKGQLQWSSLPDQATARSTGAVYYPSPGFKDLAHLRNLSDPRAYSIMGATFTLSSKGAADQVADLVLPPYRPWDALICISDCAKQFAQQLHEDMREWWQDQCGPMRFVDIQMPVIPLGVDVPSFALKEGERAQARQAFGLDDKAVVFMFAGRLSFHAKANPAPLYQALHNAAVELAKTHPGLHIVCIEAGVFPNEAIKQGFIAAQKSLAPSIEFVWVDGNDSARYLHAWKAADVFVSLSDNIQETFGLTPVEAMAAGLPVVVADWNGYKETVRDGVDGFRIPTVLPAPGAGDDLALRHAMDVDSYDMFIGRASLATVVEPQALTAALLRLAQDSPLRTRMGRAGRERAQSDFDWPVILRKYDELASHLATIRRAHASESAKPWPQRADPFTQFAHFPTHILGGNWSVQAQPEARVRLDALLSLSMANYGFDAQVLPREAPSALLAVVETGGLHTVDSAIKAAGMTKAAGLRVLMWLWKFGLVRIAPPT
jgi:glycosyltransferase involved in cell wall biosynthesis